MQIEPWCENSRRNLFLPPVQPKKIHGNMCPQEQSGTLCLGRGWVVHVQWLESQHQRMLIFFCAAENWCSVPWVAIQYLVGHKEVSIDSLACEPMRAQAGFPLLSRSFGYRPVVGNAQPWLVTKEWVQAHLVPRCTAGLSQWPLPGTTGDPLTSPPPNTDGQMSAEDRLYRHTRARDLEMVPMVSISAPCSLKASHR